MSERHTWGYSTLFLPVWVVRATHAGQEKPRDPIAMALSAPPFTHVVELVHGRFGTDGQVAGSTKVVSVDDVTGEVLVRTTAFPGMEVEAPSRSAVAAAVARMRANRARQEVLGNVDLVALVLSQVQLDPVSFVRMGLVGKAWRLACRHDETLLLKAARAPHYLTKSVFAGLFGLSSEKANRFPRGKRAHRDSFLYVYRGNAIDAVMPAIGGVSGWEARLATRAVRELAYGTAREGVWVARGRKRSRVCITG